jgi:4-amino-4-deoxy-L-arabinose transferase-like glycosyltransferase
MPEAENLARGRAMTDGRGARSDWTPLIAGVAVALLHALVGHRYGLFRDELYFIVCGRHPAFGYVDQPPLVPLLAAGLYDLGGSVWALRFAAALAAGGTVAVTMLLTRLLGGNGIAMAMAGLAAALAPVLVGLSATLSTSTFDPLTWTALAYFVVRAIRLSDDRALLFAGLVAGVSLEIKYSLLLWAPGLALGILATPERALLTRKTLWLGLALATAVALPSIIWQGLHGWPFLELGAAAGDKNADTALVPFVLNQFLILNPLFALLAVAGLVVPFVSTRFRDLRFLPIAFVVYFAVVRLGNGKDYYLAAAYPALFAIAAAALAPLARTTAARAAFATATVSAVAISALILPLAAPILVPASLAAYMQRIGIAPQQQEKSFAGTALPQLFADQLGWRDFAHQVGAAWQRIPFAERARTGIKVDNYGEAAALDVLGAPYALPPALTGHNQYFLWGLRGQQPEHLLVVQDGVEDLRPLCRETVVLGVTASRWAMAHENGKAIVWCRAIEPPLAQLWPALKRYR